MTAISRAVESNIADSFSSPGKVISQSFPGWPGMEPVLTELYSNNDTMAGFNILHIDNLH